MQRAFVLLSLVVAAHAKIGFFRAPHEFDHLQTELINEEPLILTDLSPAEAKAASKVSGAGLDKLSENYAGYFRTDDKNNGSLFFWYFTPTKPEGNPDDAPLLIWLQGGPGASSLFAALTALSPFALVKNGSRFDAVPRDISWTDKYATLFIDNPFGAGFSFVNGDAYCDDTKECVSRNLYLLLQQFYTVFPEKKNAPLYVTGESYAGHYIPGLAFYIHEANKRVQPPQIHVPLAGVAIGDGWIDPVNMLPAYPDLMYNIGIVSRQQREVFAEMCDQTVKFIKAGKNLDAFDVWDKMINGDIWPYGNLYHNVSGLGDYDNFLNTNGPESFGYYGSFVQQPEVRRAIHVGDVPFPTNPNACEMHLLEDFMRTFRPELAVLADNYKVLIYSGALDIIVGTPLTENFLPHMEWKGRDELYNAPRMVWRINDKDSEVAGYVRQANEGRFTHVIIRNAGHVAVADQPARSRDMLERFIQNLPYKNLPNPAH